MAIAGVGAGRVSLDELLHLAAVEHLRIARVRAEKVVADRAPRLRLEPRVDGPVEEPDLALVDDAVRDEPAGAVLQDVLRVEPAHLVARGNRRAELDQVMVEKRDAHLKTCRHTCPVNLNKYIVN